MRWFSRSELLLGELALERLRAARVTVFGLGGVGSFAVEALARAGVGQLRLVDNDVIDNLVDGVAEGVRGISRRLRFAQRGQMQQNLTFAFAVAAVLIVAFIFFTTR